MGFLNEQNANQFSSIHHFPSAMTAIPIAASAAGDDGALFHQPNSDSAFHWFPTERDVDAGEFRADIPEINRASGESLFQGDIALPPSGRNALRNESYRWTFPIPYILTDSLDLNAKGVILKAFEMFRLKSCVDFKPYEGEKTYITFRKLNGCWSQVGDLGTGQNLSIGERCDHKAIVEHEILHALGFYHEQSRTDRDDYVEIWWDEIEAGMGHNFNVYDDSFITDLNTPYDYESVMHYGPFSFNKNASVPTITAKIPEFNDIIGQRLDFSALDIERLNRMYNCPSSLTLLDQCAFEYINICGMVQGANDNGDWVHEKGTAGGMNDHTLLGQCRDGGYFMSFSTSVGNAGDSALLESRILYPKRAEQCLQFFYKITGGASDKLVIWIRKDDGAGNVRKLHKVQTFAGDNDHEWKIAHVTLNVNAKFRYVFQAIGGTSGSSSGKILIDDISLTETACPGAVWLIRNYSQVLNTSTKGDLKQSPCFYSPEGYAYGISLYPHGQNYSTYDGYTGISFHLCSGENDGAMEWPALNRQNILTVLDQDPDVKLRMSLSRIFTTSKDHVLNDGKNTSVWGKPSLVGTYDPECNCHRSIDRGWSTFISHSQLRRRSFLKNDDLIIFANFEDLTPLIKSEVPIRTVEPRFEEGGHERYRRSAGNAMEIINQPLFSSAPCDPNPCQNGGICVNENGKASCRCSSGQAVFYTGERCQATRIHGNVLGIISGGMAGSFMMTIVILTMLKRR
ncbi:meprin A subunit alpha-like [Ambystoma mexicanum]|uniref:meprin A subunit alpha-like n=1 Tax=Ambystoma mexicanum TaxID=8296 RepID=UPI0037E995E2